MSAVDTALWDLRAREAGRSLTDELGKRRDTVPVYGSGVNLHYTLAELTDQAQRWVDRGYRAVKVKVGRPELADDIERIAAVRAVIGPDIELMVDANQRWDLFRARRAIDALTPFGLSWVEEPLPADDIAGYVSLRQSVRVPIALGENLRTIRRFRDALTAGACDLLQPNVARVGGITPFRRIAELARVFNVPVYPHLLPDLSGQLACAVPLPSMVEDVEDSSFARLGILREPHPVAVDGPKLRLSGHAGHGLRFDERRLQEVTQ
jgi:L-alanine-DL-glutamate epimerase-like enolase superfamily enzyme